MVKIIYTFLFLLFFVSCNYIILPHKYFANYTDIINRRSTDTLSLNFNKAYMMEDTFLSKYYSIKLNRNIKSYNYMFFYKNNIIADITIPQIGANILSQKDLEDSIKSGFYNRISNRDKISWTYFEIKSNKIITYSYNYNVSNGANTLSPVSIKEIIFLKLNGGLISEYYLDQHKKSLLSKKDLYLPGSLVVKPDSSKSDFFKMYQKYMATGSRRYYPPGAIEKNEAIDKYDYKK